MENPNNKDLVNEEVTTVEKLQNSTDNINSSLLEQKRINETGKQNSNIEANYVNIVAILRRTLRSDCYVFVKQFRPNLNVQTLEFPTGSISQGETAESSALKILKETTGYIGVVKQVGAVVAFEPTISKSSMKYVTVEVDGDNYNNSSPRINSNKESDSTVVQICVDEILPKLCDYSKKGILIDSRLQAFSLGLAMGAPKKYQLMPAESVDEK